MVDTPNERAHENESSSVAARATPQAAEVGLAVTRIFRTPLAALRASMESLAKNFGVDDPRRETLSGALAEVLRLSRDVEALAAYAAPRPLMPLVCSLEEILQSTVAKLAQRDAARVTLARPAAAPQLLVDGALLSTALAHVVRVALEGSAEDVLLEARVEAGSAGFSVISGGERSRLAALRAPRSHNDASLGLGFELARREVERMQGTFEVAATDSVCVRIRIACQALGRAA
ncbi:MAG: hypothetical protein HZA52_07490 [Planctomycetes bacterium]|nr:hypothetical protein [Planctomycetota bacterium]